MKKIIISGIFIVVIVGVSLNILKEGKTIQSKATYALPKGVDPDKPIVVNGHEFDPKKLYSIDPEVRRKVEKSIEYAKNGTVSRFQPHSEQRIQFKANPEDINWYKQIVEEKRNQFVGMKVESITTLDGKTFDKVKIHLWNPEQFTIISYKGSEVIEFSNLDDSQKHKYGYNEKLVKVHNDYVIAKRINSGRN